MKKIIFIFLFSFTGLFAQFPIEINITVHNDINPDNLFYLAFGVNANAGDSVDVKLGEESLPPYPFSAFYAALEYKDSSKYINDSTKYYDDIRTNKDIKGIPIDSAKFYIKYKLHLIWHNSKKITFNWGSSPKNENIDSIFIKDALNGAFIKLNMKTSNSYELTNDGIDDLYFHVYYSKDPSSVEDNVYLSQDNIYPNPVINSLKIKNTFYSGYEIYDIYGQLMIQNTNYQDNIDVSFLSKGIYLLYLNNVDGHINICKFIKN
jgi:hypothetical protein